MSNDDFCYKQTSKNGEDYLEFWRKTKGKDKESRDYNDYSETIRCRCPKVLFFYIIDACPKLDF